MLANCRSQFLLDRLGRCIKLSVSTDSTSCHENASQFGLAFFNTRKTRKNYREDRPSRMCLLNEPATPVTMRSLLNRQRVVGAATTAVILSGDRLSQNSKKSKRRQWEFIHSLLEKCGLGIITWPKLAKSTRFPGNLPIFYHFYPSTRFLTFLPVLGIPEMFYFYQ